MILDDIIRHKRKEIAAAKKALPLVDLKHAAEKLPLKKPVFIQALKKSRFRPAVIAEIKKKSPSKGLLRRDFRPVRIAKDYERAGAAAISVLTDKKFFAGSPAILKEVRKAVKLPILRKDFVLDAYQVYESRLMGADAILLIAAALTAPQMKSLSRLAASLGLDVLVEIHSAADAKKALAVKPALLGINNRDLGTFEVDLETTRRLAGRFVRKALVVSESGIKTPRDLIYLKGLGVSAVLVGESLMREKDARRALHRLMGRRA